MTKLINLSEKNLQLNMRDLSCELVHEMYLVGRKASIYGNEHPLVKKVLGRPFLGLQKLFSCKKYFTLYLSEGRLFANNIQVPNSVSNTYFRDVMYDLEVESILFDCLMTPDDLMVLMDRFGSKIPSSSPDFSLKRYLGNRNVFAITVDTELGHKLFNTGIRYRGDRYDDFSLRQMVAGYFGGDINLAIRILSSGYNDTGKQAEETGIDYHFEIVNYILPEKFSQLADSELICVAENIISSDFATNDESVERLARLVRSFDFHPHREELFARVQEKLTAIGAGDEILKKSLSESGAVKLEASQMVDRIFDEIFSDKFNPALLGDFHDQFMRLVRMSQLGKAANLSERAVEKLSSSIARDRQNAVYLLQDIINSGIAVGEPGVTDLIMRQMRALFTRGLETFEFAEVVSNLLKAMMSLRRFEPVADFLSVLKSGRHVEGTVVVYDSLMIKRIFEDLDNSELISRLIREFDMPDNGLILSVRDILTAIQSDEVALQLSEIVSHPSRRIRQYCLKILSDLGRPALEVFSEIIRDEANFCRAPGRHELADEKWYLIRNAIFVLGNLKEDEACRALRLRLSDADIRVRLEIVRALEKISSETAADLLMILAEDIDHEVSEAAIITLGVMKREEFEPFFIDLISRQQNQVVRVISAIVQSGSTVGRDFLVSLLDDKDRLKEYSSPRASVGDIKTAIFRGLDKIGDDISKQKLAQFKEEIEKKSSFYKEMNLGQTARMIIDKFSSAK